MSDASSSQPEHSPAQWGPAAGILLSFFGFFVVQILAVLVVSLGIRLFMPGAGQGALEKPGMQLLFVALSYGSILLALWWFLRRRGASFVQLGFSRRVRWGDAGNALVGYSLYFGLLILAFILLGVFTNIDLDQKQELGFDTVVTLPEKLMAFVSLVVLPPIAEEILFRGFLFTGLRSKLRFLPAVLTTSFVFGALHLLGASSGLLWVAGVDTFILSLILCYLRERTGALWAPIMVHTFKNFVAFLLFAKII